jgi:hypothetical protein
MTTRRRSGERRWPWYQQIVDASFALLGLAIGVSMMARNEYTLLGILAMAACGGFVGSRTVLRVLTERWDAKP